MPRAQTDWKTVVAVNLASFFFHVLVLLACGLIVLDKETREEIFTSLMIGEETPSEPLVLESPVMPEELKNDTIDNGLALNTSELLRDNLAAAEIDFNDMEPSIAPEDFSISGPSIKVGDHFSGRTSAAKAALVRQFGGNSASEAAVAGGLKWLASRQLKDGSWSFDHTRAADCKDGGCTQPGSLGESYNGATAMALLAFLGGGHTHKKGDYQVVVRRGLDALLKNGQSTPNGLILSGKTRANEKLYVHALATIALCETASLTKDSRYSKPAAQALKYIVHAQDPNGGGWRYDERQPGDTSVVGWQIMALKSGQNGKLRVPAKSLHLADKFLDQVQGDKGSVYGYMQPPASVEQASSAMTAVGLLCRMYMGWDKKNPHLRRGIEFLDQRKPSPNDMYYNYYATQVMHHWGGEEWKRWNEVMRDHLVRTQVKDGIETGSWNVTDPHGGPGGRLYQTCLCVMTLEVYYRHLPIYNREKLKIEY